MKKMLDDDRTVIEKEYDDLHDKIYNKLIELQLVIIHNVKDKNKSHELLKPLVTFEGFLKEWIDDEKEDLYS